MSTWKLIVATVLCLVGSMSAVSDHRAYEVVMLVSCVHGNENPHEAIARGAHLKKWNLRDEAKAQKIIDRFCHTYDKQVAEYNRLVERDTQGPSSLQADFLIAQEALVDDAMQRLQAGYPDEWEKINAAVLAEKSNMYQPDADSMPAMSAGLHLHGGRLLNVDSTGDTYSTDGYTGYDAVSWDGTNLALTTIVVGSSVQQWSCQYVQTGQYTWGWVPAGCPVTILHTATLTAQIDGAGPVWTAPSVTPSSYMNFQTSVAQPRGLSELGGDLKIAIQILCPLGGAFFSWLTHTQYLIAITEGHLTVPGVCNSMENYCTAATTPPLVDLTNWSGRTWLMIDPPPYQGGCWVSSNGFYWWHGTVCYKRNGAAHFSCPNSGIVWRVANPQGPAACTPLAGH